MPSSGRRTSATPATPRAPRRRRTVSLASLRPLCPDWYPTKLGRSALGSTGHEGRDHLRREVPDALDAGAAVDGEGLARHRTCEVGAEEHQGARNVERPGLAQWRGHVDAGTRLRVLLGGHKHLAGCDRVGTDVVGTELLRQRLHEV